MLGFFSLYTFIYTYVADHYQYAACIGPISLVASGSALAYRKSGRNIRFIILSAAGFMIIILGMLSWKQCHAYTDVKTLWLDTLKKNPDSSLAHGSIGKILFEEGKFTEAEFHLDQKIKFAPHIKIAFPFKYAAMHYDLAAVLQRLGKFDDAAVYYRKSLAIYEYFPQAHFQLAYVLAQKGNIPQARSHYLRALEIAKQQKDNELVEAIRQELNLLNGKGE
jgi:tetratricopeptide (TPR) repeat protein